jgi:hypothetical protein
MSTATTIGPYFLTGAPLYDRNGCQLLPVQLPGLDGSWALKVKADNRFEIESIESLLHKKVRSCVEFPPPPAPLTGSLESGRQWYCMRRYDACVENNLWCRLRWKQIGLAVLDFLEDLHCRVGAAHLDIKTFNILIDRDSETFHVCDFEHMMDSASFDRDTPLKDYNGEYKWYYVMLGGDLDQPCEGWRMDLEALGFALAALTWPRGASMGFVDECRERMEGRGSPAITDEEVLALREKELADNTDDALLPYWSILEEQVTWTQEAPPGPEVYELLRACFR